MYDQFIDRYALALTIGHMLYGMHFTLFDFLPPENYEGAEMPKYNGCKWGSYWMSKWEEKIKNETAKRLEMGKLGKKYEPIVTIPENKDDIPIAKKPSECVADWDTLMKEYLWGVYEKEFTQPLIDRTYKRYAQLQGKDEMEKHVQEWIAKLKVRRKVLVGEYKCK